MQKKIKGKVWTGFIGECNKRCPCYLLLDYPNPELDAIFICDVLRKFVRKEVRITIEPIEKRKKINSAFEARKYGTEG